jgi:hypothetical protein
VFVEDEDLTVSGIVQSSGNAQNKQDAAWRGFIDMLESRQGRPVRHPHNASASESTWDNERVR